MGASLLIETINTRKSFVRQILGKIKLKIVHLGFNKIKKMFF